MKLFTNSAYAGQTLHLPIVGEVTLDKEASLEVKSEETANWLIDVTKGSLAFHKTKQEANVKVAKKSIEVTNETVKVKSPRQRLGELLQEVGVTQIRQWIDEVFPPTIVKATEDEKPQVKGPIIEIKEEKKEDDTKTEEVDESSSNADEMVNPDDIKEGIDSCDSIEELLGLVDLIPGVKKKDTKGKNLEELKEFLKSQVDKALAKK